MKNVLITRGGLDAAGRLLRALRGPVVLVAAILLGPNSAFARRVLAPAKPLMCATDGVCMFATEDNSLVGAFRLGGQELQFEALYRPYLEDDGYSPEPYPPWCVRLTQPQGEVYDTMYGNAHCTEMWYPNAREGMDDAEIIARTARARAEGPVVFAALDASHVANPPPGREEAWSQVRALMEHFAEYVAYLKAHP